MENLNIEEIDLVNGGLTVAEGAEIFLGAVAIGAAIGTAGGAAFLAAAAIAAAAGD